MRALAAFLVLAGVLHAAAVDPPSPLQDPEQSQSLFNKAFPELESTSEMVGYVASLTAYAVKFPFTLLEQSHKYFAEKVMVKDKCAKGRVQPQTSLAASEEDAYRFGRYAAAAYCVKPSVLTNWNCKHHCTDSATQGTTRVSVKEDVATGIKFFTAVNRERREVIVSFRGTLVIASVFVDAAFAQDPYTGHPDAPKAAKVHAGFQYAYKRVAKVVRKHVRDFVKNNVEDLAGYTVHVTGHSMGGAIALLAALDLAGNKILDIGQIALYTYGQPRTGNLEFAEFVDGLKWKRLTRVTANSDLIAHLPPSSFDYYHHRSEMYLQGWWFHDEQNGGVISSIKGSIRDFFGYAKQVTLCKDQFCESDTCANSNFPFLNILHHLRYFSITFGPWC